MNGQASSKRALAYFVHGFSSNKECWEPLLTLLEQAPQITEAFDLKCFSYPTGVLNPNPLERIPKIVEIAESLADCLQSEALSGYSDVMLIGHSQGGLIIQRYLVQELRNGNGNGLRRIRQLIFFATPNLGSGILSLVRKLFFKVFSNPQELSLRLLDDEVNRVCCEMNKRVWGATSRGREMWPIPIQSFYGLEDGVVQAASARGPFYDAVGLKGNHHTILEPDGPDDRRYSALEEALLTPAGHSNIYEIDSYDTFLQVSPRAKTSPRATQLFDVKRTIHADNIALLKLSVKFSKRNKCTRQFSLDFETLNSEGCVEVGASDLNYRNDAPSRDIAHYRKSGTSFKSQFTPEPGKTYNLNVKVYGGFNEGQRFVVRDLGDNFYCKKYRFTLGLRDYLSNGWRMVGKPRLCLLDPGSLYCMGPGDEPPPGSQPLDFLEEDEAGQWIWEIVNIQCGVVHVRWNITGTSSAYVTDLPH